MPLGSPSDSYHGLPTNASTCGTEKAVPASESSGRLVRATTLDPAMKAVRAQRGNAVAVFKRGSRATTAKGGLHRASCKTVKTKEHWTLWASSGAANSKLAQLRADLKRRV